MNQTLINNLNAKQIRAINRLNDEIEKVLRRNHAERALSKHREE